MTAPVPTARTQPNGTRLNDPFPTTIAFSLAPNVALWEREVQPFGLDGRDPIDTVTMFNTTVVTKHPRVLIDCTNITGKYMYDPAVLPVLFTLINQPGSITVWFATGQSWTAYGFLNKVVPDTNSDSTDPPLADIEVVITNQDPITGVEELPVYTASSGTGSIT